jgi:hypothetical protein
MHTPHPTAYIMKAYDAARPYEEQAPDSNYGYGQGCHNEQDFKGKRLLPSEASPHVIFLGLDPDFTEADVCRLSSIHNSRYECLVLAPSIPPQSRNKYRIGHNNPRQINRHLQLCTILATV